MQLGIRVDVLSRGYGRRSKEVIEVDPAGDAARFGDEPIEIARALRKDNVRVFVGASRFLAGCLAEAAPSPAGVHLLDDGMQHRRLHRDLEIVLLTAEDAADQLLPAGNLREPLSSLGRAHVVVLREEEADGLRPIVARYSRAEVWIIRRQLLIGSPFRRPFAFCAIARSQNFLDGLVEAGYPLVGRLIFPDHHAFRAADIDRIVAAARAARADGFYLTRKDLIKIAPDWLERLRAVAPVEAPPLQLSLLESSHALERLRGVLRDG